MSSDDPLICVNTPIHRQQASPEDLLESNLFKHLDEVTLRECARRASVVEFKRGAVIVNEGEPPDALYIITVGRVEVVLERPNVQVDVVDILGRGDCIGDLALLLDQQRTATVRALRHTKVVRLSADDFRWLVLRSPVFTLHLAQTLGSRLQRTTRRHARERPIETVVVVGVSGVPENDVCRDLAQGVSLVMNAPCSAQTQDTVDDIDGFRVIACDAPLTERGRRVLEVADVVLISANDKQPDNGRIAELCNAVAGIAPRPRIELVALRDEGSAICRTRSWLGNGAIASWHHVRRRNAKDFARLARRIFGRAVGIVLGGGGARGFAHIGILRALEEIGMAIDFVGGTSMGAIIGAQYAAGYTHTQMIELARESYLGRTHPSEFSLPYVSIHNGSGTNRRLKRMFGNLRIEDLPTPYFCVSSNLSTAEPVVHEIGILWLATRCSCSVPGLLPPVRRRGDFLVDGGLLENLPVVAMRNRCRGQVIAADVSVAFDLKGNAARSSHWRVRRRLSGLLAPPRMPGIASILTRTVTLASVRDARNAGTPADLYLHPPVDDIGMSDFARLDEIVERGARYVHALLDRDGVADDAGSKR